MGIADDKKITNLTIEEFDQLEDCQCITVLLVYLQDANQLFRQLGVFNTKLAIHAMEWAIKESEQLPQIDRSGLAVMVELLKQLHDFKEKALEISATAALQYGGEQ